MTATMEQQTMTKIGGISVELRKKGTGSPLVVLHDTDGKTLWHPRLDELAKEYEIWQPSHPGYGKSELGGIDCFEDLVYFYMDALEHWDLRDVVLMGCGIGGWIAAELAIRSCERLRQLILVDAYGIKISPADVPDITDTFAMPWENKIHLEWHDPSKAAAYFPSPTELGEPELEHFLRSQESTVLYGWKPFLHNPKLRSRLHRIHIPTTVIWGENDGVVSSSYGEAFAREIPNARFQVIAESAHYPYLEQPERFLQAVQSALKDGEDHGESA